VSLSLDDVAARQRLPGNSKSLAPSALSAAGYHLRGGGRLCAALGIAAKVFNTISDINVTLISQEHQVSI